MTELDRILNLPVDDPDEQEADHLVKKWSARIFRERSDWSFRPAQALAFEAMEKYGGSYLPISVGGGKAQQTNQKVLTPEGWRAIGTLEVGDEVIGSDGKPCEVDGVFPQGMKPCYKVTTRDGASTIACEDHLWAVHSDSSRTTRARIRIKTTRELAEDSHKSSGSPKWAIPTLSGPANLDKGGYRPIDPWLVGALLGDGGTTSGSPYFSNHEASILEAVKKSLPSGVSATLKTDSTDTKKDYYLSSERGQPNKLADALKDLGIWGKRSREKEVPESYLWADQEDRLALFHGLMDTDGTPSRSKANFSSTSESLADAVVFLARSFGGIATKKRRQTYYTYKGEKKARKPSFRVYVKLPPEIPYFRHSAQKTARSSNHSGVIRTLVDFEPIGEEECVCISVDARDSLYVTEGFMVTHNSLAAMCAARAFDVPASKVLVLVPARLRDQMHAMFREYRQQAHIDKPVIWSYAKVSQRGNDDVLDELDPDVIVCDEVHLLGNQDANRTKRFEDYLIARYRRDRPVKLVGMTGTPTSKSLTEFSHLVNYSLGDRSPVPHSYSRTQRWAKVLDADHRDYPSSWEYRDFSRMEEWAKANGYTGFDGLTKRAKARRAFSLRFKSAPGVVQTTASSCDQPISLRIWAGGISDDSLIDMSPDSKVREAIRELEATWKLPNGDFVPDILRKSAAQRQLTQGFYYYPDWELIKDGTKDYEWLHRRSNWNRLLNDCRGRKLRRPEEAKGTEVEELLAKRGDVLVSLADIRDILFHAPLAIVDDPEKNPDELLARDEWLEVHEDPEPPQGVGWVSEYLVDRVQWLVESGWEGIVWFEHREFGEKLIERGLDVAMGGDSIPRYDGTGAMCLSVHAFKRGFDLPKWQNNLVLCPCSNGATWEQLIGRTHRAGQKSPVTVDVLAQYGMLAQSMDRAVESAKFIEETVNMRQKLLMADTTWYR